HEGPIRMAADTNTVRVDYPQANPFVNSRFGTGNQLFYIGVVGFCIAFTDNRHGRIIENRVAPGDKGSSTPVTNAVELVGRTLHLSGGFSVFIFSWISP